MPKPDKNSSKITKSREGNDHSLRVKKSGQSNELRKGIKSRQPSLSPEKISKKFLDLIGS